MLDKSLEYKDVIMRLDKNEYHNIDDTILPDGFTFRYFAPSDVKSWSRIEASVHEFDSEEEARLYFERAYLPYSSELLKRCLFVLDPTETPIATATAWFADSELGHQPNLHWIAVCPEYQGLGLGKSIVKKALSVFQILEPNYPIWLHTQTWSHIAIRMYHSLGFNMVRKESLANKNTRDGKPKIYQNEYLDAMQVLKAVMDEKYIDELMSTAV